jgi:hypothetical protein
VLIGLAWLLAVWVARSSPSSLPSESVAHLCGHPVAQATPGRAAPARARWSTPRLTDLARAGAVWLPPGVRRRPAELRHPRAAGSRAGSPAAGGILRVQGRRSCPPEARSEPAQPELHRGAGYRLDTASDHRHMKTLRTVVVLATLTLGLLAGIVASPWLMRPLIGRPQDWRELSDVGQAYGGVSALLSGFALCGIAASLLLQWRQVHLTREMTTRERHFELVKLGLEDPSLCLPGTRGLAPEESRQWAYSNLWVSLWATQWEMGSVEPAEVRRHFDGLFGDDHSLRWWGLFGPAWSITRNNRRKAFMKIAHAAYLDAVESRRQSADEKSSVGEVGAVNRASDAIPEGGPRPTHGG